MAKSNMEVNMRGLVQEGDFPTLSCLMNTGPIL